MIRRACANRAILPRKPSKITVKAVYVRRPISGGQYDQVDVHAKTALTECLAAVRFGVGRKDGQDRTRRSGYRRKVPQPAPNRGTYSDTCALLQKELTDDLHCNLQH